MNGAKQLAPASRRKKNAAQALTKGQPHSRLLVAVAPVDFRRGIDGLARACRETLSSDPFLCVGHDYVASVESSAAESRSFGSFPH